MGWRAPIREGGGERAQAVLNAVQSPKANELCPRVLKASCKKR